MIEAPPWLVSATGMSEKATGQLALARLGSQAALGKAGFSLASPAFKAGEALDPCFTADEEDAVAPPMEWSAPPPGSQELVLIVEDPASGGSQPLLHWLVWGLPAQKGKLLEGEAPPRAGKNGRGNSEWLLPEPPRDDGPHPYVFQLFALDLPLTVMPGATLAEVEAQMKDHVTACAVLVARYERAPGQEDEDDAGAAEIEF